MLTADAARTPTFTAFARPDYFLFAGAPNCTQPCVSINPSFAWNHGDFAPDINQTWLGLAGPGVRPAGLDATTWVDQTDIRPTILALLGLHDDYRHDGRALVEALDPRALPVSLREHQPTLVRLAQVYKQLNGSVGSFGSDTLTASTSAQSFPPAWRPGHAPPGRRTADPRLTGRRKGGSYAWGVAGGPGSSPAATTMQNSW
jgi:hypothetical protein